jgi:hypothetical protein
LRIYQNQSRLHMHVDQSSTHISAILHVDHDENRQVTKHETDRCE